MASTLGRRDDEDELVASINTTPLVDIMLVLLIIFLITVPVVTHSVPVALPHEINEATQTRPETITLAVDKAGQVYWNDARVADDATLRARLEARSADTPQPEVHIRADRDVRYAFVGRVVLDCQRAGIARISFIVQPDRGAAAGGQ